MSAPAATIERATGGRLVAQPLPAGTGIRVRWRSEPEVLTIGELADCVEGLVIASPAVPLR